VGNAFHQAGDNGHLTRHLKTKNGGKTFQEEQKERKKDRQIEIKSTVEKEKRCTDKTIINRSNL
jgi:hypothetical protein